MTQEIVISTIGNIFTTQTRDSVKPFCTVGVEGIATISTQLTNAIGLFINVIQSEIQTKSLKFPNQHGFTELFT